MRKPAAVVLSSTVAIAAAFGLIACGGGDSGSGASSTPAPAQQTEGGAATASQGQTIFVQNCGTCHTLSAAGTDGNIGPNLDDASPDYEEVKTRVINGGGGMPAWKGVLSDAEIDAVSKYVSDNAGGK